MDLHRRLPSRPEPVSRFSSRPVGPAFRVWDGKWEAYHTPDDVVLSEAEAAELCSLLNGRSQLVALGLADPGSARPIVQLKLDRRGFQIMARKMLATCQPGFWRAMVEDGKFERAGGDAECVTCRLPFFEHPQLPGYPTFHMTCAGEIVKT